ncbi:lipopolysaccharide biosynthesis protein [Hydrogenophaga sp.]|uniref:lipopolysaccharide biosynthesis protein n=1 Tax=Hydrogenophaga sp. TaxID=1904254 RepID=UPI001982CE0E|nr:lipopolysaccharide biosynthesis protein [Hydrogenophaga sp.]MBD3893565.1 lipopolysaccharide biosynthesis protein [Hydrogenophaga sp.]
MTDTPRPSLLRGMLFTVATRWVDRLIGLASTLILARLLLPDDFGVIAMAALAVGLADVLLDMGVHVALIQNPRATQEHYNSAWTLRLLQNSAAALLIFFCSGLIADYFVDQRIEPVLQVLALAMFLTGLENIGVIKFQKDLDFQSEFYFRLFRRLIGFSVTMLLAWYMQSYWAMVFGTLAGRSSGIVLSYLMHPMRPRLSTRKMREIFAVSQWMLIGNLGGYTEDNLHRILVGRWNNTSTMGEYSLADDIAAMPTTELLAPINRALFPAFVAAAHDPQELKRLYLVAQSAQNLLALPAAIGLLIVADELVQVLLGPAWLGVAPFLQVLALVHAGAALIASSQYMLIVLGRIRWNVLISWMLALLFVAAAFTVIAQAPATDIAWTRFAISAGVAIVLSFTLLLLAFPALRWSDLLRTFYRPVLAGAVMALVLLWLQSALALPVLFVLLIKCTAGALLYVFCILALWLLAGRPAGGEAFIMQRLLPAWHRLNRKT